MRAGISRMALGVAMFLGASSMGTFCGPPPGDPPGTTSECRPGAQPAEGEATLVLANPQTGRAIAEGETLTVEYGDQGGQHVFVLVQQYATAQADWTYNLELLATLEDGTQGVVGSNTAIVDVCAPGWTDSITPVFLRGPPGEAALQILRIRATTEAGAELTAEVGVVPQ